MAHPVSHRRSEERSRPRCSPTLSSTPIARHPAQRYYAFKAMLISRWSRKALPIAAALASSFAAPTASAEAPDEQSAEPALRMTWESDDIACSGDDVSARALRLVTPGVVPRPLRARVEVRREADQWLVRLQTESGDQSGRRILRAESCNELKQAIALLLAMAMESKGDVLPPAPAPEQPAEPAPAPPRPPPPPAPPPPAPAPAVRAEPIGDAARPDADDADAGIGMGWFVRLDGKAAFGLKPGLGWGVGVSGGVRLGDVDIGASAAHWPVTRKDAPGRPGYMTLAREDFSLRACWNVWRGGSFALAPCIAPELTLFRFETKEVREPETGTTKPVPSATASVDLRYAPGGGSLSFVVTPGLTFARAQPFEIGLDDGSAEPSTTDLRDTQEIYRTSRFGPRLEVGVDARF